MRILHLTDHYPPVLGGIEAHVAALAARQAARGDDVTVLTSTPAVADGRVAHDRGPVRVRRARTAWDVTARDLAGFDVVHAHMSVVAPFTAPLVNMAARHGLPVVVTVHSLWNGLGPVPATAVGLAGLWRAPVLWTAVSRVAGAEVARRLPGEPEVLVLPNAVDVGPRAATPGRVAGAPVRLVSTMRIARRKRPLPLLHMLDALRRTTATPVHLTLVGDGPRRHRVERWVERHDAADLVTLTGRRDPPEVVALLAESDVYVAPALLESFGLAALEARCVGLPVVGLADSGLSEFVTDGVEGWLAGSDAELVDRLRDVVEDPALRRDVSEHNRLTPSVLTWPHALVRTDAAYARAGAPAVVGRIGAREE